MIQIHRYRPLTQDYSYIQNVVTYTLAKDICIKHIEIIEDGLTDDESLRTWCISNYSSPPTIYSGIDKRQPPAQSNTPYVSVMTANEFSGYGQDRNSFLINIVSALYDDTLTTTTDTNEVTRKKYQGIENIEAMRKLVETAVCDILSTDSNLENCIIDTVEVSYRTLGYFPYFYGNSSFNIYYIYSQGDSIFENRR